MALQRPLKVGLGSNNTLIQFLSLLYDELPRHIRQTHDFSQKMNTPTYTHSGICDVWQMG